MEWEIRIIEWMQSNLGGFSKVFGNIFAFIGGTAGLTVLLVIVMFCWKKELGQKLVLIIAVLHGWFSMIKSAVMRPRPYLEHPDRVKTLALVDSGASATDVAAQGYSFPSMHSGATTVSYFTLAREIGKKWAWILSAAMMLLVGSSRVVSGNHYPTDVLAGWILGFVVMGIFDLVERYVQKEWIRHLLLLAVTLPGVFYVRTEDYFSALGLLIGAVTAIPFERKYVNFQNTHNKVAMVLRILCGFALYFGLNTLLKMPFSEEFLESASLSALLVRTGRYAVIIFLIMGVYPKTFPLFERVSRK